MKGCPFCQGSASIRHEDAPVWAVWVECDQCEARGPVEPCNGLSDRRTALAPEEERAIELWDRRPTPPETIEDVRARIAAMPGDNATPAPTRRDRRPGLSRTGRALSRADLLSEARAAWGMPGLYVAPNPHPSPAHAWIAWGGPVGGHERSFRLCGSGATERDALNSAIETARAVQASAKPYQRGSTHGP